VKREDNVNRLHLPTHWSRVLIEKLTGSQLVKKFPAFCGTRRFITAFTSPRHLSLSRARSIQSPTSNFLQIHLNILPSTPGSSKWSLSFGFPHQTPVYTSPFPHTRYMPHLSYFSLFGNPNNIGTLVNTLWRTFWKRLSICRKTDCRLNEWMNEWMNLNVSLNTENSYPDGRLFSSSHHMKICVAASKDKRMCYTDTCPNSLFIFMDIPFGATCHMRSLYVFIKKCIGHSFSTACSFLPMPQAVSM